MGSIRKRGKKQRLEIIFMYLGVRRFEQSNYFCDTNNSSCKCNNCKSANALLAEIERKIRENTFKYEEYFPNSKFINSQHKIHLNPDMLFTTYAKIWLENIESTIEYATFKTYSTAINAMQEAFPQYKIHEIKPSHIQSYISQSGLAAKTISNYIGVLYSVFESAVRDDLISKNPSQHVKKPIVRSEKVDPFEIDEVFEIINWMQNNQPHLVGLFAIGFFTGVRVGEALSMKWSDIDFVKHTITVQRTITKNRIKDHPKNGDYRIIDIIPVLDEYLDFQKQFTFMKHDWVTVTSYGKPFMKTQNITDDYFKPCLKTLGLRYRILNQMRHSFACMMIDAGENLNWIKNTLGHSTLEMLMKRYGNRINRVDGTRKGLLFSADCDEFVTNKKAALGKPLQSNP